MNQPLILVDRTNPQITILSLNRPAKRNALTIELMESLWRAIDETQRLGDQRAIILKGEGPIFCAGLDLMEAADLSKEEASSQFISKILTALYTSSLVTLAAVHGGAIAGGAGIMMACDFTIAAQNTIFGFPETSRGIVAAQIMPFICRQISQRQARELLLLGEIFDAERAKSIGLINRIVEHDQLMIEALNLAKLIIKNAPQATAKTKLLLEDMYPSDFQKDLQKGIQYHREARHSPEAKEGIAAFLEHREPNWKTNENI